MSRMQFCVFTRLSFNEVTSQSNSHWSRRKQLQLPYMSTVHARISTRGWSLESLVQTSPNFRKVDRVSASVEDIYSVLRDYELRGVPLVIEDFHKHERWPSEMFTLENFAKNSESTGTSLSSSWKLLFLTRHIITTQDINVRNVHTWADRVIKLTDFVSRSRSISQFAEDDGQCCRHLLSSVQKS